MKPESKKQASEKTRTNRKTKRRKRSEKEKKGRGRLADEHERPRLLNFLLGQQNHLLLPCQTKCALDLWDK